MIAVRSLIKRPDTLPSSVALASSVTLPSSVALASSVTLPLLVASTSSVTLTSSITSLTSSVTLPSSDTLPLVPLSAIDLSNIEVLCTAFKLSTTGLETDDACAFLSKHDLPNGVVEVYTRSKNRWFMIPSGKTYFYKKGVGKKGRSKMVQCVNARWCKAGSLQLDNKYRGLVKCDLCTIRKLYVKGAQALAMLH